MIWDIARSWQVGISLLLFASGCEAQTDLCQTGARLSVAEPEIRQALIEDLRNSGVELQESANGDLCYSANMNRQVFDKLTALRLQRHPANEFIIAGGAFQNAYFRN